MTQSLSANSQRLRAPLLKAALLVSVLVSSGCGGEPPASAPTSPDCPSPTRTGEGVSPSPIPSDCIVAGGTRTSPSRTPASGEVWEGKFVWNGNPCPTCTITYNVRLTVDAEGHGSGTATYVSCSACAPPPARFRLEAQRTTAGFVNFAAGGYPMKGTVPVDGNRARGETTQQFSGLTYRYVWNLTCTTC